jgi:RNA polymerase sigma-70 factor (ECF subfamily)
MEIQQESETARFLAVSEICRIYWDPIFAFVKRKGYAPSDAEDFTQEFFRRLLEHDSLLSVDRTKGRLRSYLLTAVSRLLTEDWRKRNAKKRGGGVPDESIEGNAEEHRYGREPRDCVTPEHHFERQWAVAVIDESLNRLSAEYARKGASALFEALQASLMGDGDALPYAAVANELHLTEGSVKVAAFRLRKRFRELIREEISNTVGDPSEVDEELDYLFRVLSRENLP